MESLARCPYFARGLWYDVDAVGVNTLQVFKHGSLLPGHVDTLSKSLIELYVTRGEMSKLLRAQNTLAAPLGGAANGGADT